MANAGKRVLICYDITDDLLRRRIQKACEALGQRVQYSVFECRLSKEGVDEACTLLTKLLICDEKSATDSIRLYPLCETCAGQVICIGFRAPLMTETDVVVL